MQSPVPARGPAGATAGRKAARGGGGVGGRRYLVNGTAARGGRARGSRSNHGGDGISTRHDNGLGPVGDVDPKAKEPLEYSAKQEAAERTRDLRGIFDTGPSQQPGPWRR